MVRKNDGGLMFIAGLAIVLLLGTASWIVHSMMTEMVMTPLGVMGYSPMEQKAIALGIIVVAVVAIRSALGKNASLKGLIKSIVD